MTILHDDIPEDELQRAELYGLLSRLWLAPPDGALLKSFAVAVTEAPSPGAFLEEPWRQMVGALRETTPETAAEEFDALFQGVGRPEILPYASFHLSGFLNDRPLAELRDDLATLGLGRDETRVETEDHIAYVLEVMRYLIAGDEVAVCNLEQQRRFYRTHVQTWVEALCEATQAHPAARLWRAIATFTRAFVQVETQAFDMLEA
jgi:TorA maturation chaperone TorD